MTLSDFFTKLSYGVLSNLEIGLNGSGEIEEVNHPKVVQHINEGLVRLHTRFILIEKSLIIRQYDHITNYWLLKKYADSQAPQPGATYPYIIDLPEEPFTEDVIKILSVFNGNHAMPLNDSELPWSLFTPQPLLLQIPTAKASYYTGVGYQAKHPVLSSKNLSQEITIPDNLMGALESFVASKIYGNINTQEARSMAQEYAATYDTICEEILMTDTVNSSISSTVVSKFRKGGWV